jgi:LysR family transcriptional regulator, glycine cleavage system transcriptional activator
VRTLFAAVAGAGRVLRSCPFCGSWLLRSRQAAVCIGWSKVVVERIRMPPLNALRAFEVAARLRSFKRAAAELNVTPTAISHQIKLLESLVGTALFNRLPRAVVLTEAGQRLFPALRDGFDRIAQAIVDLQSEAESIALSVTSAFASKILIPNLRAFQEKHAAIRLRLDATEGLADLRKGDADLVVRYADDRPTSHRSVTLFADRYFAVAAPSHLRRGRRQLEASEVARSSLLAYPWKNTTLRGATWSEWMDLAEVRDFDVTQCHVFSEEVHAIQAAVDGLGIALLSSVLVARDLAEGRLVQVHPQTLPGFTFKAMHLADHVKIASIRQVIDWLSGLAGRVPDSSR